MRNHEVRGIRFTLWLSFQSRSRFRLLKRGVCNSSELVQKKIGQRATYRRTKECKTKIETEGNLYNFMQIVLPILYQYLYNISKYFFLYAS